MDDIEFQKVLARHIFGTPDEAAIHALSRISERDYELGGGIFKDVGGRYSATDPQGSKQAAHFNIDIRHPEDVSGGYQQLAGIYHTHPGGSEVFSPRDVAVADQLKVLSYIRALQGGNIKKYEPGRSKTKPHYPNGSRTPAGKISEGELMRQALAQNAK